MSGRLLRPDDPDFETAKRVFNPLFDGRNPIAVASCATPEDVQACVTAAAGRVSMAPRSGGHSYAGYSTPEGGLVIDVGALSKVDVHGDQVVIGAGARLRDVYAALTGQGRALPARWDVPHRRDRRAHPRRRHWRADPQVRADL
jgi:FAD/FMN-containing dehydrogenase